MVLKNDWQDGDIYRPSDVNDTANYVLAVEAQVGSSPVTAGSPVIEFGFGQSEIGHESWTGFSEPVIREILYGIKLLGGNRVRFAAWWGAFEPTTRNVFDWDGLDRAMDLCEEYGVIPHICITGGNVDTTPDYSSPAVADFANACGALAARYGAEGTGQLSTYEVWNEPNHSSFAYPFTFSVVTYANILSAAAAEIRAADSGAFILTAGMMSTVDFSTTDRYPSTYVQGLYDNGAQNSFDAVAFHWYTTEPDFSGWVEPSITETFYVDLLACRDIMVAEGDSAKQIWVTELGISRINVPDAVQRAQWIATQIRMLAAHDWTGPFFVYNYRDSGSAATTENTYGVTSFTGVEQQPLWDTLASINGPTRLPPIDGVGADRLAIESGTGGSGKFLAVHADSSLHIETPGDVTALEGLVTLSSRFVQEKEPYPLPGASPAPLTTDGGIASGLPSPTTGLKFVAWTSTTAYNYQGNYMVAAGSGLNSALSLTTNQVAQNASTPRKYTFGALNAEFQPSTLNVRFATDSTRVIPVWAYYSGYSGSNYTDMHMLVEHDGQMKHLSSSSSTLDGLPRTQSTGGGLKRRELLFSQRRFRRMRLIIPGFCYFAGVYIDTLATIIKTPNLDLYMHNGDSWNEPTGASFSAGDSPGGGFPSGSYQCLGLPEHLSFETGAAHGTYAQGGTGEENANGTSGGSATGYSGTASSAMWSTSRINDLTTKFGPQYPIQVDIGGWNDGSTLGTPYQTTYQTRVAARYTKLFAAAETAGREIKAISVGIQPVDWILGDGGFRDLSDTGRAAAAATFPDQVLGSISIGGMWDNTTTAGQRSILCLPQSGIYIHLNLSGNVSVAGHLAAAIGDMQCSIAYLEKARQA